MNETQAGSQSNNRSHCTHFLLNQYITFKIFLVENSFAAAAAAAASSFSSSH